MPSGALPRGTRLWGREQECMLLDDLVSSVRRGESRSLVLRGEAGIGKTALLEHLVGSAPDVSVVRATGVESEMELAFAGLHQLCAPLLGWLDRVPTPQQDALRIVFGLVSGPAPDRFLVGLAALSLHLGGRGGTSAAVRRGRRTVAGQGVGADARVRCAAASGRAGGTRLRGPGARRGAPACEGLRASRSRQRRCSRPAQLNGAVRVR